MSGISRGTRAVSVASPLATTRSPGSDSVEHGYLILLAGRLDFINVLFVDEEARVTFFYL